MYHYYQLMYFWGANVPLFSSNVPFVLFPSPHHPGLYSTRSPAGTPSGGTWTQLLRGRIHRKPWCWVCPWPLVMPSQPPDGWRPANWCRSPANRRQVFITMRSEQSVFHFADGIFKCIFFNDNVYILGQVSLNFVAAVSIHNKSAFFQVMTWHQTGDKPLPESMLPKTHGAIWHH